MKTVINRFLWILVLALPVFACQGGTDYFSVESPANDMVINTIFTRMIAGAGDHTNCYFAGRVDELMGSHASQMAKAICIYSTWQFLYWYDRPQASPGKKGGAGGAEGAIPEIADLQFYDAIPTVWDRTKVIDGYPGLSAELHAKMRIVGIWGFLPEQMHISSLLNLIF